MRITTFSMVAQSVYNVTLGVCVCVGVCVEDAVSCINISLTLRTGVRLLFV